MKKPYRHMNALVWIFFTLMMLLKYGYYRFEYYPVIDDWIQYGVYPLFDNIFKDVIVRIGTCAVRPLAGLADPYLWGRFWGDMRLPFFVITVLHIISGILIQKVLSYHRVKSNIIFLIFFGLLPLGFEATYWISASSRIVVGLFFMSLSLFLLCHLIFSRKSSGNLFGQQSRRVLFIAYCITQLVSLGFYEQIIVLSLFTAALLILVNWKVIKNKWIAAVPGINLLIILGYYYVFCRTGKFGDRCATISANDNIGDHSGIVWSGITEVWTKAHFPLYLNGFRRGMELFINERSYLYMLTILLVSIMASYIIFRNDQYNTLSVDFIKIAVGLFLFLIPYIPYYVLKDVWISNRNAFPSFIGLALVVEAIVDILLRKSIFKSLKSVLVGCLVIVFMVVNTSELADYKKFSQIDLRISKNLYEAFKTLDKAQGSQKSILFGTMPTYAEQNAYYHEHIHNITDSDWGVTGGVRAISRNQAFAYITPATAGRPFTLGGAGLEGHILLGIDRQLNIFPVYAIRHKGEPIKIITESGQLFGQVEEGNNETYIFR